MEKDLTRNLGLGGIGLYIVGAILAAAKQTGVGVAVFGIGGILLAISVIGALIKTAQLGRWGWFVGILLTGGIGWLIYIIAGPTTKGGA